MSDMSQYQDNHSDRITLFFCVPDYCLLLLCLSLYPASSGPLASTAAQPTGPHQHGALLPAVPLGSDTRHLLVPLPFLLACLAVAAHTPLPHWPRSLPFSDPLSPSCPLAIPHSPPSALLPVPCPHLPLPSSPLTPVQREQTELLIISVWQPLFCALIKGAACGLCVSGPIQTPPLG